MITKLNYKLATIYLAMQNLPSLLKREEGQDLIEYVLLVALIAFACTVGMKALATDINTAFSNIGTTLVTNTSSV
jgi:pilus assembly protein Flp/PilA